MSGTSTRRRQAREAVMMAAEETEGLREKARLMEPLVRLGKNGLTDAALLHIRKMVDSRKLVKVKLLRSFLESNDRRAAAETLARSTGAEVIDQVGFVVVLYKR
jgi:RNA-binding protein